MEYTKPSRGVVSLNPNPRVAFLVMAVWYGVLIVLGGAYIAVQPSDIPQGCGEGCDSDRSLALLVALYYGGPGIFLALLMSLAVLWLVVTRKWTKSSLFAGTLAAALTPLPAAVVAVIAFGAP